MEMHKLSVMGMKKCFGEKTVLQDLSFDVENGEFLSVLGPSGCGKTTLLRILIGIEPMDAGKVLKDGIDISKAAPSKRGMGIVFQNYALFPNMTVLQNVMYPLRFRKEQKKDAKTLAEEIIQKVGLEEHVAKKPNQLSGGQQQRVAIARTLAMNPDIVLFDEPMSALDVENRFAIRNEFKDIQNKFGITMLYITHDQEEAFAMSDRIMILKEGSIQQIGSPSEIYHAPANTFVKHFVTEHLQRKIVSMQESIGV